MEKDEPRAIILQAGSIEISNINVKEALMDTEKDFEQYKKDWAAKVEEDSANLYDVAVKAIEKNPTMKVIIVKRLLRYDPVSSDPKGIKSQLSRFGNHVYDQLWFKGGCPKNIHVVDFELNCSSSGYLKDLIYGQINGRNYDGIHVRGDGAQRHFTYRAVNAVKPILCAVDEQLAAADNHTNCPQTLFKGQSQQTSRTGKLSNYGQSEFKYPKRFARAKKTVNNGAQSYQSGQNNYSVPVKNRFTKNC